MSSRSPSPSSTFVRSQIDADAYSITDSTTTLLRACSKSDSVKSTATTNATTTTTAATPAAPSQFARAQEKDWSAAFATLSYTYGYGAHIAPPAPKKEPKAKSENKTKDQHVSGGLRERIARKLKGAASAPVTPSPSVLSFASLASTASAGRAADKKKGKRKEKGRQDAIEEGEVEVTAGETSGSGGLRLDL